MPNESLRFTMSSVSSAGFTLIEIILVTALSSLMLVVVLVGQHQLQAKARFDAAIDRTLQNLAFARNFALSNVNNAGNGNDATTVIAGDIVEFNNNHYGEGYPLTEITSMYSVPDASGNVDINNLGEVPSGGVAVCPASEHPDDNDECMEQFLSLNDNLTVSGAGFSTWMQVIYLNTGHGLTVCLRPDNSPLDIPGACQAPNPGSFNLTMTDPDGFSAQIKIDARTGYATRL